ncbi:hypothetical protein [Parabacteroides provencensis]|uniref:hypothetical protein n=1 Tax=Parabacteroides provencensis TaxID=1944636 RepID=UPI000C148F88|nr:hypothetical protein [Parabacteroides provencensis]
MKEKILALLKTKFPGVDEATLIRIAEKRATGVTDESQLQTIADGVGFQDVLNSYGDFRANGAVASAVANYEKKHGLKDGKPIENTTITTQQQTTTEQQPDMAKIIADAVANAVKPLSDKLSQFETEKAQATRQEQVLAKAKEYGIPESQAKRYAVPEDADLDAYFKDAKQELVDAGFASVKTPETGGDTKTETEAIASMISEGTKEIVESKK